jgi:hypothetical protein
MTPLGIEPANFQLVVQCLNQLRYRLPHLYIIAYLKINKCNIRNTLSSFVFCIPLSVSPVQVSSSNRPTYLGSICRSIFFPSGMYPDGSFHFARRRRLSYFPGKKTLKWDCRKWSFNYMLHTKVRYEERNS